MTIAKLLLHQLPQHNSCYYTTTTTGVSFIDRNRSGCSCRRSSLAYSITKAERYFFFFVYLFLSWWSPSSSSAPSWPCLWLAFSIFSGLAYTVKGIRIGLWAAIDINTSASKPLWDELFYFQMIAQGVLRRFLYCSQSKRLGGGDCGTTTVWLLSFSSIHKRVVAVSTIIVHLCKNWTKYNWQVISLTIFACFKCFPTPNWFYTMKSLTEKSRLSFTFTIKK